MLQRPTFKRQRSAVIDVERDVPVLAIPPSAMRYVRNIHECDMAWLGTRSRRSGPAVHTGARCGYRYMAQLDKVKAQRNAEGVALFPAAVKRARGPNAELADMIGYLAKYYKGRPNGDTDKYVT